MQEHEARGLVALLVLAFRPRDFGRGSEELYVESLLDLDFGEAQKAVRWGIRDGWQFLPSIKQLRDEIADDYDAPYLTEADRPSLPGYRDMQAYQRRLHALPGPEDVTPEVAEVVEKVAKPYRDPADKHIQYDPATVELRKKEARAAARKERRRIRAEQTKGEVS